MHKSTIIWGCGHEETRHTTMRCRTTFRYGRCSACRSLGRENMMGGRIKDCPPLSEIAAQAQAIKRQHIEDKRLGLWDHQGPRLRSVTAKLATG